MSRDVEKRWSDPSTFRAAAIYSIVVIAAALATMAFGAVWAATDRDECKDAQFMACSEPARSILMFGPGVILLVGGIGAFVAAYRLWRRGGTWVIWQGAGWALLVFMVIYLGMVGGVSSG